MLKRLVNGEYSLKVVFWLFGVLGFALLFLASSITHSGLIKAVCMGQNNCSFNVVKYVLQNFIKLLIGGMQTGVMPYLVSHLIMSAVFVVYMYLVLRGLWKSAAGYEGSGFWKLSAKTILVVLAIMCFKSIV